MLYILSVSLLVLSGGPLSIMYVDEDLSCSFVACAMIDDGCIVGKKDVVSCCVMEKVIMDFCTSGGVGIMDMEGRKREVDVSIPVSMVVARSLTRGVSKSFESPPDFCTSGGVGIMDMEGRKREVDVSIPVSMVVARSLTRGVSKSFESPQRPLVNVLIQIKL